MLCKALRLRTKPKNREGKFVDTWVEGVLSSGADGKGYERIMLFLSLMSDEAVMKAK